MDDVIVGWRKGSNVSLGNDQLDAHLLCFTTRLLYSSTFYVYGSVHHIFYE